MKDEFVPLEDDFVLSRQARIILHISQIVYIFVTLVTIHLL